MRYPFKCSYRSNIARSHAQDAGLGDEKMQTQKNGTARIAAEFSFSQISIGALAMLERFPNAKEFEAIVDGDTQTVVIFSA